MDSGPAKLGNQLFSGIPGGQAHLHCIWPHNLEVTVISSDTSNFKQYDEGQTLRNTVLEDCFQAYSDHQGWPINEAD